MRTRFLGTDFFFAKSKTQSLASHHFNPIYLHAPELSDPDPELDFGSDFAEIRLESGITRFTVDKALSVLFSVLRPQFQHVEAVDENLLNEKELLNFLFGERTEVQDARFSEDGSKSKIRHKMQLEKKLQFDLIELDLPRRELVTVKEKEHGLELCFGSPNIKIPLDIIDLDAEITIPYEEKLLESLYKIEKIPFEFDQEKSSSNSDSAFNYRAKITQFELKDSIISEQDINISSTETLPLNFNSVLSIVDMVKGPQEEDLVLNPSENSDILSYISENPKCEPSDDPRLVALNSVLDMEIIKLNDNNNILIKKDSSIYPLKSDGTHSDSPCSVSFQEIQIMDLDYNNNNASEIFNDLGEMDVDKTEEILKDEMDKAGEFYESIISAELALVDETFKSLPTPVFSSDEKLNVSLNKVVRELICEMKPRVFSACDMIYLDWHFSVEETYENQICCGFKNSVEELSHYDLVKELSFLKENNSVDIISFFDGSLEKSEVSDCDSKAEIGNNISECFKDEIQNVVQKKEEKKGENIGLAKASVLFESMSQGNDLNFFLGVRKGGSVSKKESCVLTEPIFIPKEPIIQPVNMLKDPLEKIAHPSNPYNKSSEKQTINSLINPNPTNNIPSINFSSFPTNNNPSINIPSLLNPNPTIPTIPNSLSDIIIIINTQSTQKSMLISRRTSYQKILNLEKNGARVVERETNIPLDLVFSAGVCLVWYEMASFGKMSMKINEGPSCIEMFIENIATNVLMSLSYSFTGCIMIFEGEINLLAAVMDLSDALYSAATNLDMNLQILCSHSADSTDDIIMTCITTLSSPSNHLSPPVPESETLAESFLTKFPSINPLSAHAILQSGGTLVDFLEWSNERRIQAVGKFRVSSESMDLFGALSRSGENGESRSVMTTECSSVGSDLSSSLFRSPLEKTKFCEDNLGVDMNVAVNDELFCGKPFDERFEGDFLEFPFLEDQIQNQPTKSISSIVDQFRGRNKGIMSSNSSTYTDFNFNEEIEQQCNNNNAFGEDIAFNSELSSFAFRPDLRNKPGLQNPLSFQKPGFGFQTFPSSAELAEETTSNYTSQKENYNPNFNTKNLSTVIGLESKSRNSNPKPGPLWRFQFPVGEESGKRSSSSSTSSRSKETYCKTRSPSIIDSFKYQKGGEKELGKKQKVESFRYQGSGNPVNPIKEKWKDFKFREAEIPEREKRKNPDLITPTWNPGEKRERENPALISRIWNPGEKRERENPASIAPTWTPVDKRARQNLSFTRQGKTKQSKLVWRKKDSPCISVSLGKKSREDKGRFQNI
ncbi:hypothetical protein LUZ60_016638 [Juncus effusus]|nr:hypothetical protein LUZ60_016638 [Juncus effusus]